MFIKAILSITFTITCMVIAIIDIQKQTIYNEAVAVLSVPAIVSFFVCPEIGMASRLLGAVSVSGIMLLMCLLIPGAFGGGDIKLMVPVGFFLGFERTLLAGMLAVFVGGFWGVWTVIWGRRHKYTKRSGVEERALSKATEFPFGPALCIGSIVVFWAGHIS